MRNSSNPSTVRLFKGILLLVGLHSIILGTVIYCFTNSFYTTFFRTEIENPFFVRQSGIFLILAGLFYLFPLLDVAKFHRLAVVVIISKIFAVIFLLTNSGYTPSPTMINLAAMGDAFMALFLVFTYVACMKKGLLL